MNYFMKRNYIYFLGVVVCMFTLFTICSCSDNIDMLSNKKVTNQKHLQKMKQLCAQYGWVQIEGVSQEEIDNFLLSEDYEKTKDFFELMKTGGETIDLTNISQIPQQIDSLTRAGGIKLTYVLHGQHKSQVASSTTEMVVRYNREELDVSNTKVSSNPACTWTPNPTSTFYFRNNRCDITVTGRVKWGFVRRDMTMKAYMLLRPNSEVVSEGKITSFRG